MYSVFMLMFLGVDFCFELCFVSCFFKPILKNKHMKKNSYTHAFI